MDSIPLPVAYVREDGADSLLKPANKVTFSFFGHAVVCADFFKFAACDSTGAAFLFEERPEPGPERWSGGGDALLFNVYNLSQVQWQETLVEIETGNLVPFIPPPDLSAQFRQRLEEDAKKAGVPEEDVVRIVVNEPARPEFVTVTCTTHGEDAIKILTDAELGPEREL